MRPIHDRMLAKSILAQFTRRHLFLAAVVLSLSYTACDSNPTETAQNDPAPASPAASTETAAATSQTQNAPATPGATSGGLVLSPANGFEGLTAIADAKLSPSSDGLLIQAETTDPRLALPLFKVGDQGRWTIHAKISSPADTTLQIFFGTTTRPDYHESNSIRKDIVKGENDVSVEIPVPGFSGALRLDPGTAKGNYVLKLFEVRPSGGAAPKP